MLRAQKREYRTFLGTSFPIWLELGVEDREGTRHQAKGMRRNKTVKTLNVMLRKVTSALRMGGEDGTRLPLGEGPGRDDTCMVKGRPQRCGQGRGGLSHLEGLNPGASLRRETEEERKREEGERSPQGLRFNRIRRNMERGIQASGSKRKRCGIGRTSHPQVLKARGGGSGAHGTCSCPHYSCLFLQTTPMASLGLLHRQLTKRKPRPDLLMVPKKIQA